MSTAGRTFQKGRVKVEIFRGKLRLRFTYQSKPCCISTGLTDNKENRKLAEAKAKAIEADIAYERLDTSLERYRPENRKAVPFKVIEASVGVREMWQLYTSYKASSLAKSSLKDYAAVSSKLECYGERPIEGFREWLATQVTPRTLRKYLTLLSSAFNWGIEQGLCDRNPIVTTGIRVEDRGMPEPFTKLEIDAICQRFSTTHYNYYVQFRFLTGMRTAEINGLMWRQIKPDFSEIIIDQSLQLGEIKSTKTGKTRRFPCNAKLRSLLCSIRPESPDPNDYVFKSVEGTAVNTANFCKRYWMPVLGELCISYREPYNTRHTFISHCLESGLNPVSVAKVTGHDVKTLFDHYAGVINRIEIPDFI